MQLQTEALNTVSEKRRETPMHMVVASCNNVRIYQILETSVPANKVLLC